MLVLLFTLTDDCVVESVSDGIREGINVVVSVDFNGFSGGIAYNEAVMAPLEVFFELRFKLDINTAVEVLV